MSLIYTAIMSLDGYIADEQGNFDWAAPDDEVHAFVNDLERPIAKYLYGRRMYDTMVYWETATDLSPVAEDYANIWRAADKIVFSTTLEAATSAKTRIERAFNADAIATMKQTGSGGLSIGGASLASCAFQAGLIDEVGLFVTPVIVGGGTKALPDGVFVQLELVDHHRFESGVVYVSYRLAR